VTDDNLSWYYRIDQMIPKLNTSSYVIRSLKPLLSFESLKMFYFSTAQSDHMVYSGVYQLIVKSYLKSQKE